MCKISLLLLHHYRQEAPKRKYTPSGSAQKMRHFHHFLASFYPRQKTNQKNFEEAQLFATIVHILQQGAEGSLAYTFKLRKVNSPNPTSPNFVELWNLYFIPNLSEYCTISYLNNLGRGLEFGALKNPV